jgi:hypothetical protein
MSDEQFSDYKLQKECESLAQDIFDEMLVGMARDETPENYRDEMNDRAHEAADWHEWVIYNHSALMLCAHCDVSNGEAFLEDVGMPEEVTLHKLACAIAYGEIRARIEGALQELAEAWEDDRPEAPEDDAETA